jgi:hypothetical protein
MTATIKSNNHTSETADSKGEGDVRIHARQDSFVNKQNSRKQLRHRKHLLCPASTYNMMMAVNVARIKLLRHLQNS